MTMYFTLKMKLLEAVIEGWQLLTIVVNNSI